MRSLNTQDIMGAQPKKLMANRVRYNGNISSINLATGEQIMNGTSLPNSPPKERIITQQQQLANSYNKPKHDYHQGDQVKLLLNDENDTLNKEIKKVNLNITPFSNKSSNNVNINGGLHSTSSNNNNSSLNMNSLLKQNGENFKKESYENLKRSLPTVNESAPRMKSDNDYNMKREQQKDIAIKLNEQLPVADSGDTGNNSSIVKQLEQNRRYSSKNQESDRYQSQPLTLSVKYPVQQGVINLFDLKKSDEQQHQQSINKNLLGQPLKNSQQINNSAEQLKQQPFLNGTSSEKNINYYSIAQQSGNQTSNNQQAKEIRLFQTKPLDQIEIKSSPEFYQLKGISTKNNVVQVHHMFNSYQPSQVERKGSMQQSQVQTNINDQSNIEDEFDEKNFGGGFYGEQSPLSPKPVEMPIFDMKASATVEQKLSQKDLLQNKKAFSQQRKIQTPVTAQQNPKNKSENTKRESKKYNQGWVSTTKEQRVIVVCETNNQTREWINRFLGMRNIQEFETFTLPGGPGMNEININELIQQYFQQQKGCLSLENKEERQCWQAVLKQFIQNLARIYQIQEIQVYQNSSSTYNQIHQQEFSGRGSLQQGLQENLKQACQFVKENFSLPVKGFMINSKGIVEKAL